MTSVGRENRPTLYKPQQIKILKRNTNNDIQPNQQKPATEAELKRTLKLREIQYQAARDRILGENYDQQKPRLLSCEGKDTGRVSIIRRPTGHVLSPQSPLLNNGGDLDNMVQSQHYVGHANSQLIMEEPQHHVEQSRFHMDHSMNLHDIREDGKSSSPIRPLTILGDKNMVSNVPPFLWQPPVVMGSGYTSSLQR